MTTDYFESKIGLIMIKADEKGITQLTIVQEKIDAVEKGPITDEGKKQLEAYFSGQCKEFNLPLNLESGTPFYQRVWAELLKIPYGTTTSYLDIAKKLGDPKSTRAVGMANGKNPIAIVVPCHRVIGSDGSLTGYAHGTAVKRTLLALENPQEYAVNGSLF